MTVATPTGHVSTVFDCSARWRSQCSMALLRSAARDVSNGSLLSDTAVLPTIEPVSGVPSGR